MKMIIVKAKKNKYVKENCWLAMDYRVMMSPNQNLFLSVLRLTKIVVLNKINKMPNFFGIVSIGIILKDIMSLIYLL